MSELFLVIFLDSNIKSQGLLSFLMLRIYNFLSATFKLKKRELQKEGFRRDLISDPLYILDNITRD